jgi:hypothetical protein
MSDYRIEAATKKEWADRALRAEDHIEELEAQNKRLRDQMRLYHISVEALSEIKASVDGKSDQPVADIIYGLLDEIAKVEKEDRG